MDIVTVLYKKKALLSKTRKKKVLLGETQPLYKVRVNKILFSNNKIGLSLSKKGKGKKGRVYAI